MTSRHLPASARALVVVGACVLAVAAGSSSPAAAITRSPGVSSSSTAGASEGAQELTVQTATASPSTVKGPTTPTVDEPGDNEPALVLGGFGLGALALVGTFVVARRRVVDDPGLATTHTE